MSTTSKAFWVEFKPYDPDAGEKVTVRICTHNHKDATLIDADNGVFLPYMSAFPTLEISAFDGSFSGEASVTVTNIEATNTMGFSKDFTKYVWDGAEVVVYKGDTSATDMADLSPMFRGVVVETPETSEGVVSWSVQDRKYLLDVDIFTETYSGDGGIDGTAEMEGAAKPVAIGYPLNIEPVLIDPAQLVYQYHGYGPTEGVMGLYENGLSFGPKRSTVAYRTSEAVTYQDLIDADCDAGEWVDCPSIGCFKLGGEPVSGGVISADVGGHLVGGYTAARVDFVLSLLISMAELPVDFTDASTFSSIYADSGNQTISDYEVSSFRLSDKITDYMSQLGGYPFVSSTGAMRFGLVRMSTPALEIRTDQTSMPIVEDAKSLSVSAPYKRIRMGGDRVFKVHDNGEVSDALYQAVFALSIEVDQATTDLYVLSDDNVISKSEKIQTAIPNDTILGRRYVELRARAVALGIDVIILDSKLQAYVSSRDAMSPSFFDTNNNTTLAANSTWRDDVVELGEELVKTNRLISEEDAKRADWDSVTGTNRPEDNATVGAPGGTNVGGREALELINDVEAQRTDIDQHEVSIGNNRVSIDGQQVTLDSHGNRIDDAEADIAVQEGFRVAQQQINIDVDQEISDAKTDIDDLVTTYGNTASSAANADAAQIARDAAVAAQGLAEDAQGYAEAAEANAEQAKTDAQAALTLAQSAQTAAETAETNAETAENNAETAENNAVAARNAAQGARDDAITQAGLASGHATTAAGHATTASDYADDAQGFASAASGSATTAQTAASNASTSESNAATSETNAAGSASSAATQAGLAATAKDNAEDAASAAATSESNAAASATTAGQHASAANTDKLAAQTARSGAETARNEAVTAQNNAAGSASTASSQATLSASIANTLTQPTAIDASKYTAASSGAPSVVEDSVFLADRDGDPVLRLPNQFDTAGTKNVVPVVEGDQVRIIAQVRSAGAGDLPDVVLLWRWLREDYEWFDTNTTSNISIDSGVTPVEFTRTAPAGAAYCRVQARKNDTGTRGVEVHQLYGYNSTAEDAASDSAAAAATSASLATTKATEAGTSATSATNSANTATTKAGEALASAGQAATSETNAAGSAVSAASSSVVAASNRDAAASHASGNLIRKGTFEDNSSGLWNGEIQNVAGPPGQNYTRALKALSIDLKEGPYVKGNWNNRTIRMRGWCHRRGNADVGAGIIGQTASGAGTNSYVLLMDQLVADDWGYFDATVVTGSNFDVATPFVRSANNGYDKPLFVGLVFEDITESTAAAGSASAAASSASTASIKADEASQSASAANTDRLAAQTARSGAESARNEAVTAKNTAESAASTASSQASLSAKSALASASRNYVETTDGTNGVGGWWSAQESTVVPPHAPTGAKSLRFTAETAREIKGWSAPNLNGRTIKASGWFKTDELVGAGVIRMALRTDVGNFVDRLLPDLVSDADWYYHEAYQSFSEDITDWNPAFDYQNASSSGDIYVYDLRYEDVTESEAAAGEAAAAASSASLASTKATEAGQSASSATTSANTATTKAGEASTSAGQAATSATSAAGSATSASTFSTLSAKSSEQAAVHAGGNLIPKPTFEDADKGPWAATGAIQGVQGPSGQNYSYAIRNVGTDLTAHPYKRGNWKDRTFRFRGWAYRPNGTDTVGVGIIGKDPSNSTVNNNQIIDAQLPVNTWTYFEQEVATTRDYETAAPFVRCGSPYGVLWVDVICEDITEQKAAAGSASAAASSATTATVKAGEASTSATNAQASANTATTKAGEASTSATNASNSATTASTAASTATTQAGIAANYSALAGSPVALTQNGGFGAGLSGLVSTYTGAGTNAPNFTPAVVDGRSVISSNNPSQRNDLGNVSGYVPVVAGRRIRTTLTAKVTGSGSTRLFAMLVAHNASKGYLAHYSTAPYYTAADGWKTVTAERTLDGSEGAFVRPGAITNYDVVSGITGIHIDELYIEDITESYEAEQSASAAVTSAANAATSASGASTSATNAQNSANTATTKAGEASSSATAAAGSATSAGNSASTAAASATLAANYQGYAASHAEGNLIPKPTFEDNSMGPWIGGFLQSVSGPPGGNYSKAIRNGGVDMLAHARRKGNWSNRTFRCRGWLNRPNGTTGAGVGIIGYLEAGGGAADYVTLDDIGPTTSWRYFDVEVTTRSGYSEAAPFVRSGANYGCFWVDVVVEDITEQKAAAAQAAIATSQAVIATAEAAAAKSTSELTARLNTGAINPNPGFLDYPDGADHPTGWQTWVTYVTSRSTNAGVGKALPRLVSTSPSVNSGMVMRNASNTALTYINAGSKYVLELDARAINGSSWKGFAFGVWWLDSSGAYINNETIAPSRDELPQGGIASFSSSYIHSWSKLATAPAGARKCDLYIFGNYDNSAADGTYPSGTRTVEVHRAVLRPATAEEVRSNTAIPALEASVAVNQGAIANLEDAAAFFEVLVAASGGNPAIVRMLAGKDGSAIDMVSDVLRIRNNVNGDLVDVATFEGGIARLNAALIRDLAVAPTPTSEIYHRVQLEPLRLTGSHNQVIQYQGGAAYSKAPNISRDTTGEVLPALPAGEAYDIRPIEITSSQFKVRAVKLVAGESVAQTSSAGSNTGGTPSWRTNKPSSANAHDGDYTFFFNVTLTKVSEFVDNEFGTARTISRYEGVVTLYGLVGSTWTALKTFTVIRSHQTTGPGSHPATKNYSHNETVNSGSNFGSGSNRFGIHAGTNATITSFTKVTYNTQTTSSEVALTGNFKFLVSPPTE